MIELVILRRIHRWCDVRRLAPARALFSVVLVIAAAVLAACGSGSPSATVGTSATPSPTAAPTPTATPIPTPTPIVVTSAQLLAIAQQVYGGSCRGSGRADQASDYSSCPFTNTLAQRIASRQAVVNQLQAGGYDVLCSCQNGPSAYNPGTATVSGGGGTATIIADYGGGSNNVTFTLTVITQNGQLLVDDITVKNSSCAHPMEIDATGC